LAEADGNFDLRQKKPAGLPARCNRNCEEAHAFHLQTDQETIMRTLFFVVVAALLAGCATTPATNMTKVYDHKYNTVTYVAKQADSEFVGTSATAPAKKLPSWYKSGHP
jgi:hypothetical protein